MRPGAMWLLEAFVVEVVDRLFDAAVRRSPWLFWPLLLAILLLTSLAFWVLQP